MTSFMEFVKSITRSVCGKQQRSHIASNQSAFDVLSLYVTFIVCISYLSELAKGILGGLFITTVTNNARPLGRCLFVAGGLRLCCSVPLCRIKEYRLNKTIIECIPFAGNNIDWSVLGHIWHKCSKINCIKQNFLFGHTYFSLQLERAVFTSPHF